MKEILFERQAVKDIKAIPNADALVLKAAIERLAAKQPPLDIKKLINHPIGFRLRVGKYRVLFDEEEQTIRIYRILLRKEAYK